MQGVTASSDGQRIETVHFKPTDAEEPITLPCAFFADCTGPACGGMKWIEQAKGANWEQPKKSLYGMLLYLFFLLQTFERSLPDPKLLYTTAILPIPERVRHKLPLYDHPDYEGGYDKLTYIKVLTCGRRDDRGLMVYRVEGDRCTFSSPPVYPLLTMLHVVYQ